MMGWWGFGPLPAAFLTAALAVRWTLRRAGHWGLVDEANHRSLHSGSKPRTGGLGLLLGIGIGWLLAAWLDDPPTYWTALWAGGAAVAGVSLLDDFRDMPAWPRLLVHFLAGAAPLFAGFGLGVFALPGLSIELGVVSGTVLTLLFMVWFINLYNFMDGMDGFAGGMALFGFGALAVLGFMASEPGFALAAGVVAAAAGGFLLFNFPPARVFMGDVGSALLGFLAGAFSLWAAADGIAPLWVSILIFSPFFLDATVTAGRRVLRRERFWEAHKTHYYQRAVEAGWSHRRTVLAEYGLMVGCALTAIAIADAQIWLQWLAVAAWLGIYGLCAMGVHRLEHLVHTKESAPRSR